MDAVRSHFRPEFLNRLDDILLFRRLDESHMGAIVDIQLSRLQKLLDDRRVTLKISDQAKTFLAEKGYDPSYGARPLKRVIQNELQNKLAEKLLSGEVMDGQAVRVDKQGDALSFATAQVKVASTG